jgi:hypothetical protein
MKPDDNQTSQPIEEAPNHDAITTPGKNLTLGQLCAMLDRKGIDFDDIGDVAKKLIIYEESVASNAYLAALAPRLHAVDRQFYEEIVANNRQKDKDALIRLYVDLGLAGPHQAAEFIRDIESQAVAQVPNLPPH